MFKKVYSLIIKELLAVLQDKKSRLVLILPPIIQLFIFAFAATLDVTDISIGILNDDYGKLSYELVQRFKGFSYIKNIEFLDNQSQVKEVIDNQKVIMVVHIKEDFSKNLLEGRKGDVQLILDGRKSNTSQIVLGYAIKIVQKYAADLAEKIKLKTLPSVLITRNWFNSNLIYTWFTVPGLVALLTMITCVIVIALSLARERESGTFDQLLVSPLNSWEILLGKAIPGIIIGMAEGSIILLAAIFLFDIPFRGSIIMLYLSLFIFVWSIVGIGLFLSSLCNTQQQALLASFVFISVSVILSGFGTPIETMPLWLQKGTYINPLRFMLVIVRGVFLKNLPIKDIFMNLIPIFIIAIINLSIATWFFRKKLE
jgi:ABC-2 type transport system permease protein